MQDAEKGKEAKVSSSTLGDHQPSCQTEISEIHNTPNLPAECLHSLQVQVAEEVQNFPSLTSYLINKITGISLDVSNP
ncbi:hypothetical protein SLA2020_524830 [Shorea laevis]